MSVVEAVIIDTRTYQNLAVKCGKYFKIEFSPQKKSKPWDEACNRNLSSMKVKIKWPHMNQREWDSCPTQI